ncbi:nitrite reductase large subunit NirB [Thermus tengchongensis]|uniref:Nitrite reductase large subunit n=1 Tax=Thermus tengchongensis TaxID=1214928 RepID=A0ABY2K7N4_9DEIN|nr:nitrite reductase large subunit NirB [Thermus tengchongensis]TFU14724.1 nitrite reductase large subunit [Thermus tengchongensis]
MGERIVVVGNGMVGHKFLEVLRNRTQDFRLTVISEEPHLAYDRVRLSEFFHEPRPNLSLGTWEQYAAWGVERVNDRAVAIDRERKVVRTTRQEVPYDVLVLATGAYPFVPPIEGRDLAGCFTYRTIEDVTRIEAWARNSQKGVVIGGGLLGLEAAGALLRLGLETHVVEFAPRLMPMQLDELGARLLKEKIEAMGIGVHLSKVTQRIEARDGRVRAVHFADGESLEADLVIFAAGIRPRDELARSCGLEVGERGGIVIDEYCRTSDPHIYAIGDCAAYKGRFYGLVGPGYEMARVVAERLTGGERTFTGPDLSTKLKLLGVEVASFGDALAQTKGAREVFYSNFDKGIYKKVVVSSDRKRLLGGILVGDTSDYARFHNLYLDGSELEDPEHLLLPPAKGEEVARTSLPLTARVCSCENVTKGTILEAIRSGHRDLTSLKKATRAGTGCGGCVPVLDEILKEELKRLGEKASDHLCEHFPYSRRELFDIIRVKGYRTFDDLLRDYGKGYGCEVCKPAVASILASLHNEHVLEDAHAPIQDTNDRFLANIQRDGTYSVVPRVPGGEITPDQLIALGQVAKKYGLYTKITGGQRVDLFGARLEQLPHIWADLIAAGFESGHAYAKAVRTVKSCVGSTWCRYGVQDSVGLAIRLENRYKGLRAPHKIKMGVSGCTRECAEAQGKDVGVIATERGWNLYVGGNGGMRPRHADLLAADLDEETLVRYIDRFLMFYIRTADKLQRTSVWLEKLEGGIDYLREVIVEDKLGLAAELEAQMARHIESYQCEWKAVLEDPSKLRHFRHFVNSDAPDDNIVMVPQRGQHRPAYDFERDTLPLPVVMGE